MTAKPIKVLVADDEPHIFGIIEFMLTSEGYVTLWARDGIEVLQLALSERPSLIIMDLNMPRMDGLNAIRKMKQYEELKKIPVIILTARNTQWMVSPLGAEFDVCLFLNKPFSPSRLLVEIKQIIQTPMLGKTQNPPPGKLNPA